MKLILSVLKKSGAAKRAAGVLVMCVLGMAISYGGLFLVGGKSNPDQSQVQATPAEAETAAEQPETATASEAKNPFEAVQVLKESLALATISEPEPQEPEGPRADRFNLAFSFPEGADQTDPMQSYGGKAFRNLYERDNSWNENVFGASSQKPLTVAGRLGVPRSSLMGKYNITDNNHDPNDPSTWVVGKWK